MVIFWLASLGANADLRARFNTPVTIESCFNDGSAISSNHCTISKRAAVAGEVGLALMSAVAGVSALEWYVQPPPPRALKLPRSKPAPRC